MAVCAFNEGKNIGHLLNNILYKQALSCDSEVLVVCSGCTDTTNNIVQQYAAKDSRIHAHFEEQRTGKTSAVNYILKHANGDILLFVSADTLPKKGTFAKLISKLADPQVGVACGNPKPVNEKTSLVGKLVQLLWGFHGYVFESLNDHGLARHATEIFCVRKGIVDKLPAGTINDDAYIAITAKKKGWLIKYDPQAQVFIHGPDSFQEYFQQRRRIIFGHYQIRKLTGESPQYLVHMMPTHTLQAFRLLPWLFIKNSPFVTAAFLFAEFWVNALAISDYIVGKNYAQWSALESTKSLVG